MNNNSNLQKSLKKAFEEHREPLHEAQWDRLSAALGDKKPKRRIFPWIFVLAMVVTLSLAAGYWIGQDTTAGRNSAAMENKDHSVATVSRATESDQTTSEQEDIELSQTSKRTVPNGKRSTRDYVRHQEVSSDGGSAQNSGPDEKDKTAKEPAGTSPMRTFKDKPPGVHQDKVTKEENVFASDENRSRGVAGAKSHDEQGIGNTDKIVDMNKTPDESIETLGLLIRPLLKVFNAKAYKREEVTELVLNKFAPVDKKNKNDREGGDVPEFSRFAIGFTSGISHDVYNNAMFSEAEKMHKDTRTVYDNTNRETKTSFANLFFDLKVLKHVNLTFNSGIQYRQLQSVENIAYKYNNIPFRDTNGAIFGYLFVADTMNPEVFTNNSIRTTRFVTIPLTLGYTIPIGTKNELQLNGGVVLNKLVAAKGSTFSLNDLGVVDIRDRYNKKTNLGFAAGGSFYRCLFQSWWLGVGIQFQQNKAIFETQYGSISSRINITNYAFNIKYKF